MTMRRKKSAGIAIMAVVTLSGLMAGCGQNNGGGSNNGGTATTGNGGNTTATAPGNAKTGVVQMTWTTWGNPGELTRFYQLTKAYNKTHPNVHWTLQPIPNSGYLQKLQTELAGGKAADVFYMGDSDMPTYVKDNVLLNLTPYLGTGSIKHKVTDWPAGVWGAAKQGNNVWGLPPDCNPMVLYFNKTVLKNAGVTADPIKLYQQGKWTWDEFEKILSQVKAHGKYGFIQDNWWAPIDSWVGVAGGQIYNAKNQFVGNTNKNALKAYNFIEDNLKNKTFVYSGSLPKGQGDDAMFMSNQVAFVTAGRWYAPEFNADKNLSYDVVPYPTPTGKLAPTGIALSYVGINKRTSNPQLAWDFLDYFVSDPGVKIRLSNGGNAVPALAHGPDKAVMTGKPAHASYILQERQIGFPVPKAEATAPGLSTTISNDWDLLFLGKSTLPATLNKIAQDVQKAYSGK